MIDYMGNSEDAAIMHGILVDLGGEAPRKLDLFSLYQICKITELPKYLEQLKNWGLVEECEVRVFDADLACYEVTQAGFDYLRVK